MPDKPGFQIGSRFYPFAGSFRLGDPVLVEELTGLDWDEFVERLPDEDAPDEQPLDPVAMLGLVGVAVWQANPGWRRDRVLRYVQSIPMENVETVGPEADEEEGDPGGPPAAAETGTTGSPDSASSASASGSDSASPSEPSSPTSSGASTSPA